MMLYIWLAAIALFSWIFLKWWSSSEKRFPPPSPPGWPIVGNVFEIDPGGLHVTFYKWAEKYGPIFSCNLMGTKAVLLNNQELLKKVFISEEYGRSAIDRTENFPGKYIYWDHKGIITGRGTQKTFNLRRLFHNALHFYGEGVSKFEEPVQAELRRLTKEIEKFNEADFDPKPVIRTSIGNILAILLSGELIRPGDCDVIWQYIDAANLLFDPGVSAVLTTFPFMRNMPGKHGRTFRNARDARDSLLERFYEEYKKTYQRDSERGLVDYFFKMRDETTKGDADAFTDVDFKALVIDIIAAGTLTSVGVITSAILLLLHNPHCAEKMRKEIHDVIGVDEAPALEHKGRLPYVDAVILEVLRLTGEVPYGAPHALNKEMEIDGYKIEKGAMFGNVRTGIRVQMACLPDSEDIKDPQIEDPRWCKGLNGEIDQNIKYMIFANYYYIHHDPKVWGDPWAFRPERFLDNDGFLVPIEHPHRQRLFLFGVGRRNCVGETLARSRIFLYLATLYQKFDIKKPTNRQCGSGDVKDFISGNVLLPGPFMVRAMRRW